MSELFNREDFLKSLIKRIHDDPKNLEKVKEDFMGVVREMTPIEIAKIEQELVNEGMPAESIQLMCNIHLDVFKEALSEDEVEVEPWHPLHILVEEHRDILNRSKELRDRAARIRNGDLTQSDVQAMANLLDYMDEVEKYFLKEENVLFPYLERHGLVQPPAIMWKEHDEVRGLRKKLRGIIDDGTVEPAKVFDLSIGIGEIFSNHIYKEHKILFPSALKLLSLKEWRDIRTQFDGIGYFAYHPMPVEFSLSESEMGASGGEGFVNLGSGYLTVDQLRTMMSSLPFDITFVDADDTVRFFSEGPDRIFVRTRAVIGRKVQNCHPQKSVNVVDKILADFKAGERDVADFWLNLGPKMVYIKYIALRDPQKSYIGTLEVTQNIAPLRELEGEKRIYDAL
jgi:DUF438 domain-containing protein